LTGWQLLKLGNPIKMYVWMFVLFPFSFCSQMKHPFRADFKTCVIVKTVFEETQREKILGFNIPSIKEVWCVSVIGMELSL
jgi:hypothetical protein